MARPPAAVEYSTASAGHTAPSGRTPQPSRLSSSVLVRRASALVAAAVMTTAGVLVLNTQASAASVSPLDDPASYKLVANYTDPLTRTVFNGLGTSPDPNKPYYTRPSSSFRVSSGAATIGPVQPGQTVAAVQTSVINRDEWVRGIFSLPSIPTSGNGTFISLLLRRQDDGIGYHAQLRIGKGGVTRLSIVKINPGGPVTVANESWTPLVVHAHQMIGFEARISNDDPTYIAERTWWVGHGQPSWQRHYVDKDPGAEHAGSGAVGLSVYQSTLSGPASVYLHSLQGWDLVPVTPPAPPTSQPPTSEPPTSTPPTSTPPTSTPPTSTPPTSTPPPTSGDQAAGALSIGAAKYGVPNNAVYVSASGSDTNSGSIAAPMATIAKAISRAGNGGTVVLRAGTYNQYAMTTNSVTIENYPGEAVWLDGSIPVTGWTHTSAGWVHGDWNYQFDHSASFSRGSNSGNFVNPAYPMAAYPDMVTMDGQQLAQTSSSTPAAYQFSVNYGAHTITVGTDPTDHAMRASNLQQALILGGGNSKVLGIGIRNYATSLWQMGTLYLGGHTGHDLVQNVVISNNATQGLSVDNPGTVVDHLTSMSNGMTGIHANNAGGSSITDSLVTGNNREHFNPSPSAAGIKISRLSGFTISGNTITGNLGVNGIWTDENVTNFVISDNTVTSNGGKNAVINELSGHGVVAGNLLSGAQQGYTAFDSGNIQVYNNTFRSNSTWDIGLSQDDRWLPGHNTAGPNVLPSAYNPWLVENVDAANNDLRDTGSAFQYYVLDKATHRSANSMNLTIDGNLFVDRGTSGSYPIAWGWSDNTTISRYADPGSFQDVVNPKWTNAGVSTPSGWMSTSYAVPMPSSIAQILGVATGSKYVGVITG